VRPVFIPFAAPAATDGPRCADCAHVWRSKDGPGFVCCVAFDEPLRADARRRILRCHPCLVAQRLFGAPLPLAEPALPHELLDAEDPAHG